jgi:hypothetical protein
VSLSFVISLSLSLSSSNYKGYLQSRWVSYRIAQVATPLTFETLPLSLLIESKSIVAMAWSVEGVLQLL